MAWSGVSAGELPQVTGKFLDSVNGVPPSSCDSFKQCSKNCWTYVEVRGVAEKKIVKLQIDRITQEARTLGVCH